MSVAITLAGLGIVGFLLVFMFFKFENKQHEFLRLLLLGCLFGVFILLGKTAIDGTETCELVNNYTYNSHIYGNNFTYPNGTATYHWDYAGSGVPPTADEGVFLFHLWEEKDFEVICYTNTSSNTANTFYKLTLWIVRLITGYLLVYLIWYIFGWVKEVISGKRGRAKENDEE